MDNEIWKDVKGYEGLYEVSNLGRIRSLGRICNSKNSSTQHKKTKILTQEVTIFGYCRVRLYDNEGKARHYAVHRLVLNAFIGFNELQINHINEIKTNNRLENLEYCSPAYNCNYGSRNSEISKNAKGKHTKRVVQLKKDGTVLKTFDSRVAASTATGVDETDIGSCCNRKRKSAGGYLWENE